MDSTTLINFSGSKEDAASFKEFNQKFSTSPYNDLEKWQITREQYKNLWKSIIKVVKDSNNHEHNCIFLATLRILSRNKASVEAVTTDDDVLVLLNVAGLEESQPTSDSSAQTHKTLDNKQQELVEACQCLSNLIYQSTCAARVSCTAQYLGTVLQSIKRTPPQHHALTVALIRLLFLITALQKELRRVAVDDNDALVILLPLLDTKTGDGGSDASQPTMQRDSVERIVEVLKVMYSLSVDVTIPTSSSDGTYLSTVVVDPSLSPRDGRMLTAIVMRVRQLLLSTAHTHEHTQLMHSHCINYLVSAPTCSLESLIPASSGSNTSWWGADHNRRRVTVHKDIDVTAVVQILAFLHARLNAPDQQSSEKLTPVLTCLVSLCQNNKVCRHFVRQRVMPPLKDVSQRPEEGNSLRSRLVKLMTSPVLELKHLSATLLFVLCSQSVERLIKYSGYGNCAGLLASLGLLAGGGKQAADDESDDSDTEEYDRLRHMVNPVTGCYEPVRPNPLDDMTEEQKEYETIKLVNALDKLIRRGDIKPCTVGADGRPEPLVSVLQLQDTNGPTQQEEQEQDD